jgi:predicted ABC-type ATPase
VALRATPDEVYFPSIRSCMPPKMFIVAGPPGSGKSTAFPVAAFGVDCFNADDRAAGLNRGSYIGIPQEIRHRVNTLFEAFVLDHIERRSSCAFETTLRGVVTFEQAALARRDGFVTEMRYLCLPNFQMHLERVKMRADRGGHSAPEPVLRAIYESSIANLPRAIREMDLIYVYENGEWGKTPEIRLQAEHGEIVYRAERLPHWVAGSLARL